MKKTMFFLSLIILLSGCESSISNSQSSDISLDPSSEDLTSISSETSLDDSQETSSSLSYTSNDLVPTNDDFGDYYANFDFTLTGTNLKSALSTLINTGKKLNSYTTAWTSCAATNEVEGDSSKVLQIYSRQPDLKSNQNTGGTTGWNREHVAPKANISSDAENDAINLWAADPKVNNNRGNLPMGEVTDGTQLIDSLGRPTDCYKTSAYFEPTDAAKGEVARTLFYMAVCYGINLTSLGNVDDLLAWNIAFPPDEWREIRRINIIHQDFQKNRNPFVDFPQLADLIW
ncbi:MAG: endonuclease [Bacilli bacterium]|jgi:endonuclease I